MPQTLLTGVGPYLLAMLVFVGMDTIAKSVLESVHIVAVVWVRFCLHFGLLCLFAPRPVWRQLRTHHLALQLTRGGCWIGITFLFYAGLRFVPLAESIMLMNTAPLMVAVAIGFGGALKGERLDPVRWLAIGIGFVGVLIVLRPGSGALHWGAIFPLLAAAGFAGAQIVTRRLSFDEDPWTTLLYTGGVGAIALTPFGLGFAPPLDTTPWLPLVALGVLSVLGEVTLLAAFRRTEASVLAPYQYTQTVWAMASGVIVFGERPDLFAILGAMVIVLAGVVVWRGTR